MAELLGGHSGDDSYWTAELHISKPSPCDCPPDGLLKVEVYYSGTNLVIYLDQHGISRPTELYPADQITIPTLHLPGTMDRAQYYSFLQQWLQSSHLNLPWEDDVATDLTNRVIDRVFERLDLHGNLAISVTVYLHHLSIQYASHVSPPPPPIDSDDEDDDEDEDLSEYWVYGLSCLYRFVAAEEHRRFGNCSICLEGLVSNGEEEEEEEDDDDGDDDKEEEGNKYLFRSPCGHVFHDECMVEWLRKSDSCPLCRFTVSSQIDYLSEEQLLLLLSDSR